MAFNIDLQLYSGVDPKDYKVRVPLALPAEKGEGRGSAKASSTTPGETMSYFQLRADLRRLQRAGEIGTDKIFWLAEVEEDEARLVGMSKDSIRKTDRDRCVMPKYYEKRWRRVAERLGVVLVPEEEDAGGGAGVPGEVEENVAGGGGTGWWRGVGGAGAAVTVASEKTTKPRRGAGALRGEDEIHNACPPSHCRAGQCEFEDKFVHVAEWI